MKHIGVVENSICRRDECFCGIFRIVHGDWEYRAVRSYEVKHTLSGISDTITYSTNTTWCNIPRCVHAVTCIYHGSIGTTIYLESEMVALEELLSDWYLDMRCIVHSHCTYDGLW